MAFTLTIGQVGDTLDFNSASYKVADDGWTPKIADRTNSQLGNKSPYGEVLEEIILNITGDNTTSAEELLDALIISFQKIKDWERGNTKTPSFINFLPDGSTIAQPYKALLTKLPESWIILPPNYITFMQANNKIENIRLRFWRRGLWVGGDSATVSNDVDQNNVLDTSIQMSDTDYLTDTESPIDITFYERDGEGFNSNTVGYLVYTSYNTESVSDLIKLESSAASLTTDLGSTTAEIATGNASGGSYTRLVPDVEGDVFTFSFSLLGFTQDYRAISAFMLARQAVSSDYGWLIAFQSEQNPSSRSRWYEWIPPTDTSKRSMPINIGEILHTFPSGALATTIQVLIKPFYVGQLSWPSVGNVADALEIDYFVFVDSSKSTTNAIRMDDLALPAGNGEFLIENNETSDYTSTFLCTSSPRYRDHLGNTYMFTKGYFEKGGAYPSKVKMILMACDGNNQFNMRRADGTVGVQITFDLDRQESYLIPR